MKSKLIYGIIIGCLVVVSGILYLQDTKEVATTIQLQDLDTRSQEGVLAEVPTIVVYVTGAVKVPDVYEVNEHSRLHEVIEIAGGFEKDASKESLNLARFVFDGEKIYVPLVTDTAKGTSPNGQSQKEKISINQGSVQELMTLTGIGETKAEAIISYRKINGPFQRIEDIMKVNGIKDAMYNKIKDDIVI